jgi:hypothetical protein
LQNSGSDQCIAIQGVASRRLLSLILMTGYLSDFITLHQCSQADTAQKIMNLLAQVFPQMVRKTGFSLLAIALSLTLGYVNGFIDRINDVGNDYGFGVTAQCIPASRTTYTTDQTIASEPGEQLLQIGQRYALSLGYVSQIHRLPIGMDGQIKHGGDRIPALGCQTHLFSSLPIAS